MVTKWALKRSTDPSGKYLIHSFRAQMLVLARRGTKVQVSFCCKVWISSSMTATQAGFLTTYLNPFGSVDARRAQRSPDELKIPRFARWRVLNIPVLARVIIGWEPKEEGESTVSSIEVGSEVEGGKVEPAREISTCTDSSTRSEQISQEDELDRGMCGDEVVGEMNQYCKDVVPRNLKYKERKEVGSGS